MRLMFDLHVGSTHISEAKPREPYVPVSLVCYCTQKETIKVLLWKRCYQNTKTCVSNSSHTSRQCFNLLDPTSRTELCFPANCGETTYPVWKLELVQIRRRRLCLSSQLLCPLRDLLKERWQFERLGDQRPAHGSVVGISLLRGWGSEVITASLGAQ